MLAFILCEFARALLRTNYSENVHQHDRNDYRIYSFVATFVQDRAAPNSFNGHPQNASFLLSRLLRLAATKKASQADVYSVLKRAHCVTAESSQGL